MGLSLKSNKSFFYGLKKTIYGFFLLIMGIFLFNSSVNADQQSGEGLQQEYTFGAGDILEVSVFGEPEISKSVFVRIDGRISLPLIGDVQAADNTAENLAQTISAKLVKFISDPTVTVILTQSNSKAYYILGQILTPGQYLITQQISVLQAIAKAGGLLEWAKKSKIMIVSRPGTAQTIKYFNYDDFLGGNNIDQNITINPGDTIVIP